jgi:hypothetical protein
MRIKFYCVIQAGFGAIYRILAIHGAGALRVEQIGKGELVSDLRILAIGPAQVLEFTNCLGGIIFGQAKNAVLKHCVIVDGILRQDVLHACDAILIRVFRTGNFHQVDPGWQVIGGFAGDVFHDVFRF